jgi:hypothetical protein
VSARIFSDEPWQLRTPCKHCGSSDGRIRTAGFQDCVFCAQCGKHLYNAPKTETGREARSVATVHEAIKPKLRAKIFMRASGMCEVCGARGDLHVGHCLSVKHGLEQGLTETELNDESNLIAICPSCNLGMGKDTIPLRLAIAMVLARARHVAQMAGEVSEEDDSCDVCGAEHWSKCTCDPRGSK